MAWCEDGRCLLVLSVDIAKLSGHLVDSLISTDGRHVLKTAETVGEEEGCALATMMVDVESDAIESFFGFVILEETDIHRKSVIYVDAIVGCQRTLQDDIAEMVVVLANIVFGEAGRRCQGNGGFSHRTIPMLPIEGCLTTKIAQKEMREEQRFIW